MNIDPELLKLLQKPKAPPGNWGALKDILIAQQQAKQAVPGQPGIIEPEEQPNMPVYDPNQLMLDNAAKQTGEQPDYLPPIPPNLNVPDKERLFNMLRLLENHQKWRKGETH